MSVLLVSIQDQTGKALQDKAEETSNVGLIRCRPHVTAAAPQVGRKHHRGAYLIINRPLSSPSAARAAQSLSSTANARANCSIWAVTRSTACEEEASIIRWRVEHCSSSQCLKEGIDIARSHQAESQTCLSPCPFCSVPLLLPLAATVAFAV